jgi:replication factor A1
VDLEQIVQQILLVRHDLKREELLKKIYEKKRSAEDYFLDEVAARIVASELGVEIQGEEEAFHGEIAIKNLVSGLNDVTVVGRVITIYPVQTFSRNDLTEGKVCRLLLSDQTGILKLVLWDNQVELVEASKIRQGQIIKVIHAYVREGFDGKLELHLGKKGGLEDSPKGVDEKDFPQIGDFADKIGELTPRQKRTNVSGIVTQVFLTSNFNRHDGTAGQVRRLRLRDNTGETTVVLWNEKVNELGEVAEGEQLRITNARIKTQLDGRIELHVENATQVDRTPSQGSTQFAVSTEVPRKIVDLKEEGGPLTIEATVASSPDVKEVTTAHGEKVLRTFFDLTDDTGKIRITLWRKHAEIAREVLVGTRIKIKNAYAKKGFSNLLELVSRTPTTIEIISKPETSA